MKKFLIAVLLLLQLPTVLSAQWLSKAHNSIGNWQVFLDNRGIVCNNGFEAGARWKSKSLIFGGGLWIGGKINKNNSLVVGVTKTYDFGSGVSQFVPGSFFSQGQNIDSSQIGSQKYDVKLSSNISPDQWSVRSKNNNPVYIDDLTKRASSGSPYLIGDEDMFVTYKNTDSSFWTDTKSPVPEFEIHTQLGFWGKGVGQDVVIIRNQLIYLSTDTLFEPVVALGFDGDIANASNQASQNTMRGFIDQGVQGCYFTSGSSITSEVEPLLGIYLLRGTSNAHIFDNGITTLRRSTISNDPSNALTTYDFMTRNTIDVTDDGVHGDMRALIASKPNAILLPGDTIYFDYALFATQPNATSPFDTTTIINTGREITNLYKTGTLSNLSVRPNATFTNGFFVSPNPVEDQCLITSRTDAIYSVEIANILGTTLLLFTNTNQSNSIRFSLNSLPNGFYYAKVNNNTILKIVKR